MFFLQESCTEIFLLERILQADVFLTKMLQKSFFLARYLQDGLLNNALPCKILKKILQDPCKAFWFNQDSELLVFV